MFPFSVAAISMLMICLVSLASIDGAQVATSVPPPGGMMLLPGYKHEPSPNTIDSRMGRIVKDGGPVISYDIGLGVGSFATPTAGDKTLWVKEISVGGGIIIRVNMQADEKTLFVDIGRSTGFAAQQVATKEDLTEVLMMLMSYKSR